MPGDDEAEDGAEALLPDGGADMGDLGADYSRRDVVGQLLRPADGQRAEWHEKLAVV